VEDNVISLRRVKPKTRLRDSLAQEVPTLGEPDYPYGLQIDLQQETLERLKMDVADYKVGDVIYFDVLAEVRSLSSNQSETGKSSNMSLQITDMGISEDD
jgi:hypothetical protein